MPASASASASASAAPTESITTEPVDVKTSSPFSLHRGVYARRAEYVRPHRVRVKVGTWNVAACPGTDKDVARWFVHGKGLDTKLSSLGHANKTAVVDDGTRGHGVHVVGGDEIGLYVLGLQEIIGLKTATSYASRVYTTDNGVVDKWKAALEAALPTGYTLVDTVVLYGMLLLIYASAEVAQAVSNVSSVSVGTGLLGYLGNKGGVATRIMLGETTRMVFVNCHLASGDENTVRRIWDAQQVMDRVRFPLISVPGEERAERAEKGERGEKGEKGEKQDEMIHDADFVFFFGDFNFRLEGLPGDDMRRLLLLHARGEYSVGDVGRKDSLDGEGVVVKFSESSDESDDEPIMMHSAEQTGSDSSLSLPDDDDDDDDDDNDDAPADPHNDPESLQATLDSLLPHDQLRRVMRKGQVFHDGWHEGPITFLPTYKYDVGTVGLFDSSEKKRAPSWCDRILYRTRRDMEEHARRLREEAEARRKDDEMTALGIDQAGDDDELLFDVYDPEMDGDDPAGDAVPDHAESADHEADHEADGDGDGDGDADADADADDMATRQGFVDRIQLDLYTSHQRITSSDHKPVVSIFTLDYHAVVPELKAKVYAEVARELDRAENEGRPVVTIVVDSHDQDAKTEPCDDSSPSVDLGEVRFLQKRTCSLTVANTGRVSASLCFVETPTTTAEDGPGISMPRWLATSFVRSDVTHVPHVPHSTHATHATHATEGTAEELGKTVTLEPGETVKAVVDMCVDDASQARMLNKGKWLDEVLVLRVTDGRDHFVPVRATWSPTCIGRSVDELIRVPDGGIRAFAKSLRSGTMRSTSITNDMDVHNAAPKELFRLTEAADVLTDRVLADEQMLDEHVPKDAGWPFEQGSWRYRDRDARRRHMADIVDMLDRDMTVNEAFTAETPAMERLEAVGEVLVLFLGSLTDGIISRPLWARIEAAGIASLQGPPTPRLATSTQEDAYEDDKGAILDILGSAPHHNISFVFLTTTLARTIAELAPLSKADLAAMARAGSSTTGSFLGKRSLSFRRRSTGPNPEADALAALDRRMAKERRFGELFGRLVCRAPVPERERERRNVEDKQRAALELFLRKRGEGW